MDASVNRVNEHTISVCLAAGRRGFALGNRLSLPFRADIVSILIGQTHSMLGEPDLITDFSPWARGAVIIDKPDRLDIYFHEYTALQKDLGNRKGTIVVTCCEEGDDIFDPATHIRLVLSVHEGDSRVEIARQDSL
jgi:hypothetical protein